MSYQERGRSVGKEWKLLHKEKSRNCKNFAVEDRGKREREGKRSGYHKRYQRADANVERGEHKDKKHLRLFAIYCNKL